jgi:GMP synthase PP-ATPase subunit
VYSGKKVVNTLLWDLPKVKRFMALRRKGIGVKGDQRVFGSMLLKRVVESEKA